MSYTLRTAACLLSVMSSCAATASAQEQSDQQLASYLISGWRSERERLVSGKVQIESSETRSGGRTTSRAIYSFDRLAGTVKSRVTRGGAAWGAWMLTPEYLAQCPLNGSPVVSLTTPTAARLDFANDLDPRCLGMALIGDYKAPPPFEEIAARVKQYRLDKITRAAEGLSEIEWSRATDRVSVKYLLALNPSTGFSCDRYEVLTQIRGDARWLTASRSTARWSRRNGVWVPESVTSEGTGDHRVQLTLAWDKVNEELPADEFQIDTLGVPAGTPIAEARLSPKAPILVGRTGQNVLLPPPPAPAGAHRMVSPWTALVVVLTAAVGVAWLLFVRRRRRGQSPSRRADAGAPTPPGGVRGQEKAWPKSDGTHGNDRANLSSP